MKDEQEVSGDSIRKYSAGDGERRPGGVRSRLPPKLGGRQARRDEAIGAICSRLVRVSMGTRSSCRASTLLGHFGGCYMVSAKEDGIAGDAVWLPGEQRTSDPSNQQNPRKLIQPSHKDLWEDLKFMT